MKAPADHRPPKRVKDARRMRGFEAAGGLLKEPIRKAGETRGFAVTKLLTHWPEIAGGDLAPLCRPVKVSYGQGGFGATLTLLASLVQMQLERLKERVNAIYGFAAIARIRLTQTAAEGFSEPARPFEAPNIAAPSPQALERARAIVSDLTQGVGDSDLKAALARFATNMMTRRHLAGPAGLGPDGKDTR
jgi:hypothetical protein